MIILDSFIKTCCRYRHSLFFIALEELEREIPGPRFKSLAGSPEEIGDSPVPRQRGRRVGRSLEKWGLRSGAFPFLQVDVEAEMRFICWSLLMAWAFPDLPPAPVL